MCVATPLHKSKSCSTPSQHNMQVMVLEDWFIGFDGVLKVITAAVGMLSISERGQNLKNRKCEDDLRIRVTAAAPKEGSKYID